MKQTFTTVLSGHPHNQQAGTKLRMLRILRGKSLETSLVIWKAEVNRVTDPGSIAGLKTTSSKIFSANKQAISADFKTPIYSMWPACPMWQKTTGNSAWNHSFTSRSIGCTQKCSINIHINVQFSPIWSIKFDLLFTYLNSLLAALKMPLVFFFVLFLMSS